ncbi:hypothetical protein YC2023_076944 [Brassica napus]
MSSEPELGKEPPVLASLKTFLKLRLSLLESSDLLKEQGSDFLEIHVEGVTGRHQMLVVNDLDETLNPRFLRRLLGRVLADDLARVLLESGHEAVSVRTLTVSVVEGTDDHGFLSGVSALKKDHCLVLLQELHHCFFSLSPLSGEFSENSWFNSEG